MLPGAYYVVRMLDGRIDMQGTIQDLRAQGALAIIEMDAKAGSSRRQETKSSGSNGLNAREVTRPISEQAKRPRQLVKDEGRQTGSVKWSMYKTYMKASSYYTWAAVLVGAILYQFLGLGEKIWIKLWGEVSCVLLFTAKRPIQCFFLGL